MATSLFKLVGFGSRKAGLLTVGYRLYNADGTANGSRITAGIVDRGNGYYSATVSFPDAFTGTLRWDTGEDTPAYADDEINLTETATVASAVATALAATGAAIISPYASGSITVKAGDAYGVDAEQRILIPIPDGATWPADLSVWTIVFYAWPTVDTLSSDSAAASLGPISCNVLTATAPNQQIEIPLTKVQTASLTEGSHGYEYKVQATLDADTDQEVSLIDGRMSVVRNRPAMA